MMDGVLVVDKPMGMTSHDVVARVRRVVREARRAAGERGKVKVGHTGTLDPDATGVLVVTLGRATRLTPFLQGSAKTYDARMRLGVYADNVYRRAGDRVAARHDEEERRQGEDPQSAELDQDQDDGLPGGRPGPRGVEAAPRLAVGLRGVPANFAAELAQVADQIDEVANRDFLTRTKVDRVRTVVVRRRQGDADMGERSDQQQDQEHGRARGLRYARDVRQEDVHNLHDEESRHHVGRSRSDDLATAELAYEAREAVQQIARHRYVSN